MHARRARKNKLQSTSLVAVREQQAHDDLKYDLQNLPMSKENYY